MKRVSAVYKIINEVTGDFYIGSSVDVMNRWAHHKCSSTWKNEPNKRLYQDMQKYGLDKFKFQIIIAIIPERLKQTEQDYIEMMKPTYNDRRANGWDVERIKKYRKAYQKVYRQTEEGKDYNREHARKGMKKYYSQLCNYNGEILTLGALRTRFRKADIEHPTQEAKKYLIQG